MHVIGLGNDMINISRIEQTLERWGLRFIERTYTEVEIAKSEKRLNRAASYAKRFAAKEACAKALGTGMRQGVNWKSIGVINLPSGQPTMELTGGALKKLEELTPDGMEARIALTISDDHPWAQAIVLITAHPVDV
ncbi:MAG: holo-ACP synthase [Proteobacteria bacterium]|nr:holo-ACP synthase [Pseudomonadota bacterium]